jgi:hypothetical protein
MLIGLLFWFLTLVGCTYATAAGGRDGRWAALMIISASLLSIPAAHLDRNWSRTELGLLTVDGALFLGLYLLALRSRSHFPIWMAGFQLVSVATHVATVFAPEFTPRIYRAMGSLWAVPITIAMVVGVWLDARAARSPRE